MRKRVEEKSGGRSWQELAGEGKKNRAVNLGFFTLHT